MRVLTLSLFYVRELTVVLRELTLDLRVLTLGLCEPALALRKPRFEGADSRCIFCKRANPRSESANSRSKRANPRSEGANSRSM